LDEDDPILSFLTVHDVILDEYRKQFERVDTNFQFQFERLVDRFFSQTAKAIESAVGKKCERFLQDLESILDQDLESILDVERNSPRRNDRSLSVVLWGLIGISGALSTTLLLLIFS